MGKKIAVLDNKNVGNQFSTYLVVYTNFIFEQRFL